jgi:hypothetical protein
MNLPIYLNATFKGAPLYECLGFVVRKDELLTSARLPATHMIKENCSLGEVQS